ncbi:hypothetical protein BC826DRAFT_1060501, partial [Russula brevipes]
MTYWSTSTYVSPCKLSCYSTISSLSCLLNPTHTRLLPPSWPSRCRRLAPSPPFGSLFPVLTFARTAWTYDQNSSMASCHVTNGPSRPAFDVPLRIFCFFHPSVFSTYTECYVGWSCTTKMVRFSFRPRLRPCPAESPAFYDPYISMLITLVPCSSQRLRASHIDAYICTPGIGQPFVWLAQTGLLPIHAPRH